MQSDELLLSATPLFLIAAADTYFFGVADGRMTSAAGALIQVAIMVVAALVIVPNMALRLSCTILLLIVAILGSMTIGLMGYLLHSGSPKILWLLAARAPTDARRWYSANWSRSSSACPFAHTTTRSEASSTVYR